MPRLRHLRLTIVISLVAVAALNVAPVRAAEQPLAERAPSYIYKTVGDRQLKVDVFYPSDWKRSDSRPAIVFYSGGGFRSGGTRQFLTQAEYFAKRGLVTIRAEYRDRTRDDATVDICLQDAISAMRWVRSHAAELGVDPNRIVASGGSAGGFLASSVAAVRDFEVPGDDTSVSHVPNALVLFNPVVDLARGDAGLTEESSVLKRISAAHHLTSAYPPTVILIGSEDGFLKQVEKFVKDGKELGVRMEIDITEGQPHAFFNRDPWTGKTAERADQFLQAIGYLQAEPQVDLPKARNSSVGDAPAKNKNKAKNSANAKNKARRKKAADNGQ